jgi:endonuclease G, mitochondrial
MHSFVLLLNVLFVTATESLEYGRFTLEFECLARTATRFHYFLSTPESGFVKRPRSFYYDPWLRRKCQQLSLKPYDKVRANYTRGHLVTSGDFKDDEMARRQTHFMTNIVPQTKQLNEGPWAETENIASCLRPNVEVMGGVIFNDESNDYFTLSHGVKTPDQFWKVVIDREKNHVLAWMFLNNEEMGDVDEYLVSVAQIDSQLTDGPVPIEDNLKHYVATHSRICERSPRPRRTSIEVKSDDDEDWDSYEYTDDDIISWDRT